MDYDSLDSPFELAFWWWIGFDAKMAEFIVQAEGRTGLSQLYT